MQDFDYYVRNNREFVPPAFEPQDPEYFSRTASAFQNHQQKQQKRASRTLALATGLCIVSFTVGLVTGLKFAGGPNKALVDPVTRRTMSELGHSVSGAVAEGTSEAIAAATNSDSKTDLQVQPRSYPKKEFPFAVRVGGAYDDSAAREAAGYLSSRGHTVIIARDGSNFRLYTGPYTSRDEAEIALKSVNDSSDAKFYSQAAVIKR